MPALIRKNGDSFWFITHNDGPWQVYSSYTTAEGHYASEWGIVNICDGKHRKVGKVSKPGSRSKVNNHDKAQALAKELNAKYRVEQSKYSIGYNTQDLREEIIFALNFCTTYPGAACYNGGVPELVRRLEAINKTVGEVLAKLHSKDEIEYKYGGVMNAWALSLNKGADIDLRESQQEAR